MENKNILLKIHDNLTNKSVQDFRNRILIIEKDCNDEKYCFIYKRNDKNSFLNVGYNKELAQMVLSNIKIIHSINTGILKQLKSI